MTVLILGASSSIGKAVARLYAGRSEAICLVGRNAMLLEELADDLTVRGASRVVIEHCDLLHSEQHRPMLHAALEQLGSIDIVLICHGVLPDQQQTEVDVEAAREALEVNAMSVVSLLIVLADLLKTQGRGKIAVLTSVAGERGRLSNYTYGAAKSLVSTYLQGLRSSLLTHGIQVIDIRPGLVDTPMTSAFDKGLLWSTPEQIAPRIVKGIDRNQHTIYTPAYWRFIMLIIRCIPEILFRHLRL